MGGLPLDLNVHLPQSPLYDPKQKIRKLIDDEDIYKIHLRLWRGGLYTDKNGFANLPDDKEWRRPFNICDDPVFIDGKADRFDAIQGALGDCWLAAGIEALTLNETLFNHVVPPDQTFGSNYCGAFHFRIWQLGTWYDVVVDDELPVFADNGKLCYMHCSRWKGNVFWAALLEKAYVKMCGQGQYNYSNLEAGIAITAFQDFSGGILERFETSEGFFSRKADWYLNEVLKKKAMICCSSVTDPQEGTNLLSAHAYIVTGLWRTDKNDPDYYGLWLVRVMNPWGEKEWKGPWSDKDFHLWKQIDRDIRKRLNFVDRDDGEFWMNEDDFFKNFDSLSICHLGPGQYRGNRLYEDSKTWKTLFIHGEWVKDISAGGSKRYNRSMNPQFRIELKLPDDDSNRDGMCTVVIELTHRSKVKRELRSWVGFYLYAVPKYGQLPTPLPQYFFDRTNPLNEDPFYEKATYRAYLMSTSLYQGEYCIVPCSEYEDIESQFLLRVFSESLENMWEHDTQIGKSLEMQEPVDDPDIEVKALFYSVSCGEDEIHWVRLKTVLESAMNPNRSNNGIFTSLFGLIQNVFGKFISLWLNDPYEGGEVVFSKDECRQMIAMLDSDCSGKLNYSEFSNLWKKLRFWTVIYENHKDKAEGSFKITHLRDALSSIGYDINKRTVHSLRYNYADEGGNISLTDFLLCGVTLETVLQSYKQIGLQDKNKITFKLEEWIKHSLIL